MGKTAAFAAGQTVTVKAPYAAYRGPAADNTAWVRSIDRDGTLELVFADGEVAYFDSWEVTAEDARTATGCYCPSDCNCKSSYRTAYCGCTGKH